MKISTKPMETLGYIISNAQFDLLVSSNRKKLKKPGEFIERCKPELRKQLRKLTSDEARNMIFVPWRVMDDEWQRKHDLSKMLMDFDKRLKQ